MHYHLEIIMPPTNDIEGAINQIMAQFSENAEPDEDGYVDTKYSFWDFYVIGGRYSGKKIEDRFDQERLDKFYEALQEKNITVSGITCGKQELSPSDQIPVVDALWREHFPDGGDTCPLFSHYNDQYKHNIHYPDVMTFNEIPENLRAYRCIVAAQNYQEDGLEAKFMIEQSMWNGVTHIDSKWSGSVKDALEMHKEKLRHYKVEYAEKVTPKPDWLVVTVDYHS